MVSIITTGTAFPLQKQNTGLATHCACNNIVYYRFTTYFVNFVHETFLRNMIKHSNGHTMAQAVSRRVLNVETRIHLQVNPCGIVDKVAVGQAFIRVHRYSRVISIIPPWPFILIYHLGMNNRPVGGRSSETQSRPIDMNITYTYYEFSRNVQVGVIKNVVYLKCIVISSQVLFHDGSLLHSKVQYTTLGYSSQFFSRILTHV
jgi:hypothetical protein